MKVDKIVKKINKKYNANITAEITARSIVLSGELDSWQDIVEIGKAFVGSAGSRRVVNKIELTNAVQEKTYMPDIVDKTLEDTSWDVVVIGGGIIGASIARELSRNDLRILVLEKHSDVAHGASGANDGMVHAGIDIRNYCKKLHYGLLGNAMYADICKELDVPFERCGQYVVFSSKLIKFFAKSYVRRAKKRNIPGVKIIGKKEIDHIEPTVAGYSVGALKIPSSGIVSPYKLTIAYMENAVQNGVNLSLNTCVLALKKQNERINKIVTNRGTLSAKVVINCAGIFADKIAEMADDQYFSIHPRKGTDLLMDSNASGLPKNIISLGPTLKSLSDSSSRNTKGGGIIITSDHNVLLGPNAEETPLREDTSCDLESIDSVFYKQQQCCPTMKRRDVIAYFAGVRAATYEEDFVIEPSSFVHNLIHVAGIQSPGLTAAPAIAIDVSRMATDLLALNGTIAKPNKNFVPKRKDYYDIRNLPKEERNQLIKSDGDFGKIVCRCEEVSLGEIKYALNRPFVVPTVDGVKRRTRSGMGRCQGGFCTPQILEIISEQTGEAISEIRKGDIKSNMCFGFIQDIYKDAEK